MDPWHLDEPFWRSRTVHGESLLFLRGPADDRPKARLLFRPGPGLRLRSATGLMQFEEGRDFDVNPLTGTLSLRTGTAVPSLDTAALCLPLAAPQAIAHRVDDPAVGLLFGEGRFYHDLQVEATYDRLDDWTGYVPGDARAQVPRLAGLLQRAAPLQICMTGDSISAGANASGVSAAPPGMPAYGDLVASGLAGRYGSQVSFRNFAVGGMGAAHGIEAAAAAAGLAPDLVIIAYGMNDVGRRDPDGFAAQITQGMQVVRAARPEVEFILVATMLGNPEWVHTPPDMFTAYRSSLAALCGPGVVLADLTCLWGDLLRRKTYHDLTGNGVNHPNDFGHRLYAQVILDLLGCGSTL